MRRVTVPAGVAMIAVTFGLARYGYGLLLPDMRAGLDLGAGTAGLVGSGTYLSYLLANTVVVPLTGRYGVRPPLLLATLSATGGMVLVALATGPSSFAAGVLVAGAAAGFAFPPYADVVARTVEPRRRASAWAAVSSGTGWGVALAGPLAVLSGLGWRGCWLCFAAIALVAGTVAVLSAPAGAGSTQAAAPVRLHLRWFVCPRSGPLLAGAVLVGAGSSVWWAFSVDAMQSAGVAAGPSRLVYALCGAAGVVASLTGSAAERVGRRAVHQWAVLALGASLALLGLATAGAAAPLAALVLAAGLFGVSYNAVIAVQGLWNAEVFAERPSAGLAAVSTALTAGTLAGPAVSGFVIDAWGYLPAMLGAAVLTLGAGVLAPPAAVRSAAAAATR